MSTLLADPAKMIAKGAPRVIHNEEELEAYTNALFRLTALENPSRTEQEAIELLTLLIERYEETSYPIPKADAGSIVRFLLQHQDLTGARPRSGIRIEECSFHVPRGGNGLGGVRTTSYRVPISNATESCCAVRCRPRRTSRRRLGYRS